jgi:hypothetical protein
VAVITYEEVAVSLGRPISDAAEQAQVAQWIADVELLIGARLGDVTLLDQDVLAYVVREAVVARLSNPSGLQSETIDDYTYRYAESSRRVSILDEWWDLLSPDASSAAFTIRPYGEPGYTEPDAWWSSPTDLGA